MFFFVTLHHILAKLFFMTLQDEIEDLKEELSPITGKPMIIVAEKDTVEFRGESYSYTHFAYRCEDSGEQYTTDELDEVNTNQVYNAYRERHGYPYPDEITKLRQHYGLSASMMSEIMGFGANQWRLYEAGKVPNESNARAITAIRNKSVFLDFLEGAKLTIGEKAYNKIKLHTESIPEYVRTLKPSIFNGYTPYLPKKTAEVIKYFCNCFEGVFVTKMNKLLFYSDFIKYKREGYGLTGLEYRAITHGPVPIGYGEIYSRAEGIEMEEFIYPNGTSGILLQTQESPNMEIFSDEEKEILAEVSNLFKDYSAGKISEQSHQEKGWIEYFKEKKTIPYSYAFDMSY